MVAASSGGRRGFTLVELLVVITIIVMLVALFGGAISAARNGAQVNTTTNAIARLDQIISTQFRRYESRAVSRSQLQGCGKTGNPSAIRAWYLRTLITYDMPDRWSDVGVAVSGVPTTAAWAGYAATKTATNPSDQYGGAECMFMMVMQGGFADCLDCNGLAQLKKGDKDGDGAPEFWDDWNNPIDYLLWAPAFQRSGDTAALFAPLDAAFPATGAVRPGLGMRPLIYSAGPDGRYGLDRGSGSYDGGANFARTIGADSPGGTTAGAVSSEGDRTDNIVNVELKSQP